MNNGYTRDIASSYFHNPMPQPIETVSVDTQKIACDGDKASGHPRVFLNMGTQGFVDCPYCGKHFVLKEGAHGGEAH